MYQMQANASSDLAKDYLSKRKIPDLFEVNFNLKKKYLFMFISGFNNGSYD